MRAISGRQPVASVPLFETATSPDHGPGMPLEQMARLRQPFAWQDESRGNAPGAGLGLAIVERIARLRHGEFTLANRPEVGLEAAILLPL